MTDIIDSPVDRVEAAAEALKTVEETEVAEQQEEAAEETIEEEDAKEEKTETASEKEETEEVAEDKSAEPENWRWQQLRKREKQLNEYEARIEQRMNDLEEKSQKFAKLERLLSEDPEKFAAEVGNPDDVYERWTNRRLNEGKPSEEELWKEIQSLKKQLTDRDAAEKQKQEEYQKYQETQRVENQIRRYVESSDEIDANEELSSKFPSLAVTTPSRRKAMINFTLRHALENRLDVTFNDILKHVDSTLEEEYAELDRRKASRTTAAQKKQPEAQGAGKPAARRKTLTNVDEAEPSVNSKPMSREERVAAAARELPDFKPGM